MKKKSLDVQLSRRKNRNYFSKDKKIKKIYKKFSRNLFSQINNEKFCIGVSGGPDSLALSYLSKIYSIDHKTTFKTFIVNHNLRNNSYKEAKIVRQLLLKHNIHSKILNWKGKVPKTNIQSNARNIRYKLIFDQCTKLGINNLIMGHHVDDLMENFFIRLFRGSGLKGLSTFSFLSQKSQSNKKIIRPLISINKNDLIYVAKKIFGLYVVDPSNFKEIFLRTKIRKYIKNFRSDGLDLNKIKLTIKNLYLANKSLENYLNNLQTNNLRYLNKKKCLINYDILNESEELVFRIFGSVISKVGNNYYPPRGKDLKNLIFKMKSKKFTKSTLGKCIIERVNNSIIVKSEFK